MRAVALRPPFTGPTALHHIERPAPEPGPGQVRLRMTAVSLNYRDLLVARGAYGKLADDRVPCSDGVGVIDAVGSDVSEWSIGMRVNGCFMPGWSAGRLTSVAAATALGGAWDGVLAEQIVLPADGIVAAPAHLSDAEASCLPCAGVTAWQALLGVQPGETVVVLGTGGVAMFAIQLARAAGARVIVVTRSPAKEDAARQLGAHEVVIGDDWDDQIYHLTGNDGADRIIELGGVGTLPKSIRAVRMAGVISLIGTISGIEGAVPTANLLRKGITVQGIFVGSRQHLQDLGRALTLHRLTPRIERSFTFDQAQEAYAFLATGSHVGKVVITL